MSQQDTGEATVRGDRAYGALLGLAIGDAIGFPAMYHRTVLMPVRRRGRLWDFSREMDRHRINKFSLPFTLSQPEEKMHLCGTDDTEFAVVSALILAECGDDPGAAELFAGWQQHVITNSDVMWSGIGERASVENARKGLTPPATGNDHPHHFDDGAVSRAVPIGVRFADAPERAVAVAGRMAEMTNAADGVWAAQAMAASIAAAVRGELPQAVVAAGMQCLPESSWIGRKVRQAQEILEQAGSGFAAVPLWSNKVVNSIYNYGNVAPETLAVAYAVFLATGGRLSDGIALAALMPKQADSMPAMVGALAGASQGADAIPTIWAESLDTLKGVSLPHLKGMSLRHVADGLVKGGTA